MGERVLQVSHRFDKADLILYGSVLSQRFHDEWYDRQPLRKFIMADRTLRPALEKAAGNDSDVIE